MEESETQLRYPVEFTHAANTQFYEVAEYLYEHYSLDRADQITTSLKDKALSLDKFYYRGSPEPLLSHRPQGYRYLLFERSKGKFIKIIYYVNKTFKKVYVTDFFPTEKDDSEIVERNK